MRYRYAERHRVAGIFCALCRPESKHQNRDRYFYRLLEYLIRNQGTAQSRLTLLKNVWDKNFDTNTNVVDVYVNYLRSKIDKDFDRKLIRTVVGVGYMMEA